jgi:hypothetical protein
MVRWEMLKNISARTVNAQRHGTQYTHLDSLNSRLHPHASLKQKIIDVAVDGSVHEVVKGGACNNNTNLEMMLNVETNRLFVYISGWSMS